MPLSQQTQTIIIRELIKAGYQPPFTVDITFTDGDCVTLEVPSDRFEQAYWLTDRNVTED